MWYTNYLPDCTATGWPLQLWGVYLLVFNWVLSTHIHVNLAKKGLWSSCLQKGHGPNDGWGWKYSTTEVSHRMPIVTILTCAWNRNGTQHKHCGWCWWKLSRGSSATGKEIANWYSGNSTTLIWLSTIYLIPVYCIRVYILSKFHAGAKG